MPGATTGVCQAVRTASSISQEELSRRRSSQCECDRLTGHDWQVKPLVNCLFLLLLLLQLSLLHHYFPSDVASQGLNCVGGVESRRRLLRQAVFLFVSEIISRWWSRKSACFKFLLIFSCGVITFGCFFFAFFFFFSNPSPPSPLTCQDWHRQGDISPSPPIPPKHTLTLL